MSERETGWVASRSPTGIPMAELVEQHEDGWRLPSHPTETRRRPGPLVQAKVYETKEKAVAAARRVWGRV